MTDDPSNPDSRPPQQVDGGPSGPGVERTPVPVVLLHGLAVSHRYLMPTAAALRPYHPVEVPDLPGFGHSGKPRAVYGPVEHAEHVASLLSAPTCVVGHSFGAEVAAEVAARHPALVRALVLIGPTSDPAARTYRGQIGRWLRDTVRENPVQAFILLRDVRDAGLRRVFGTLRHSVHNAIEQTLAKVPAPVLLIRGSRDPVAPRRWLSEAAAACAGPATTAEVSGAPHNVVYTAGPQVAELIRAFLAEVGDGPAVRSGQRLRTDPAGCTDRAGG